MTIISNTMANHQAFPEFFHENYNSHMFLMEDDDGSYSLYPPNQCDWFYKLTELSNGKWLVNGFKDDVFDCFGPQETTNTYTLVDDRWQLDGKSTD